MTSSKFCISIGVGTIFVRHTKVFAVLIAGGVLLSACTGMEDLGNETRDINLSGDIAPAGAGPGIGMGALVKQTGPSYVTLTVARTLKDNSSRADDGNQSIDVTSGSGFVVDGQGHAMTAAHVAINAGYTVTARGANGRLYSGKVIAVNPANDMALVKIVGFGGRPVVPAASACLGKGDSVFSLGKPHAQGDTARVGTVEQMHFGRAVQYGKFGYPDAIVLRMATKKGESGGPLFNSQGQLAGMVVSTLADGNGEPLNLAHAVPSTALAEFMCSKINCTPAWQRLAQKSAADCS
jgi:S1-C subfamily serine protease